MGQCQMSLHQRKFALTFNHGRGLLLWPYNQVIVQFSILTIGSAKFLHLLANPAFEFLPNCSCHPSLLQVPNSRPDWFGGVY